MSPIQFGLQFRNEVLRSHAYVPSQSNQPGINFYEGLNQLREPLQEADPGDKVEILFQTTDPSHAFVEYALRKTDSEQWSHEDSIAGAELTQKGLPKLIESLKAQIQQLTL